MRTNQVYSYLYRWVNEAVNWDLTTPVKIIQSYQNVAQPTQTFITIDPIGPIRRLGKASRSELDDNAQMQIRNEYQLSISVRQVGGQGEYLQKLIDNSELSSVQTILDTAGISLSDFGNVIWVPVLVGSGNWKQENWLAESVLEVRLIITSEVETTSNWIETVEVINNINQGE